MEEFALSIPEAIAIVGSVAAIVFGAFMYVRRMQNPPIGTPVPPNPEENLKECKTEVDDNLKECKTQIDDQLQLQHERISLIKDRVTDADAEIRLASAKLDNIQKMLNDHEGRDVRDFTVLNQKFDKMTDIVIKILSDDKL